LTAEDVVKKYAKRGRSLAIVAGMPGYKAGALAKAMERGVVCFSVRRTAHAYRPVRVTPVPVRVEERTLKLLFPAGA
jgi:hypothetical protein